MAKVFDCGLKVSELELQSFYYILFRTNALAKKYEPFIPIAMGKVESLLFDKDDTTKISFVNY